jgi:hypothetical protein
VAKIPQKIANVFNESRQIMKADSRRKTPQKAHGKFMNGTRYPLNASR